VLIWTGAYRNEFHNEPTAFRQNPKAIVTDRFSIATACHCHTTFGFCLFVLATLFIYDLFASLPEYRTRRSTNVPDV